MVTTAAKRIQAPVDAPTTWGLLRGELQVARKAVDAQTGEEVPSLAIDKPLNIAGMANAAIVDRVNEMLDPRGCDLTNYLKNPVFLCDHNYFKPIGTVVKVAVEDDGVHFEAEIGRPDLAPLTEDQLEKRSLIAQGILKTVSVGFIPHEMQPAEFDDAGALIKPAIYTKWELLEISVVSVPCNADSIFQMKEFQMAGVTRAAGALPMGQTPKTAPPAAPAGQQEPDGDEPVSGTAGDYLKAIHEAVGHLKSHMSSMHEKMDGLHSKVDGLKPADDGAKEPDEDDKEVTQITGGEEGKPEPVKAVEARMTKLEENLGKLADGVARMADGLKALKAGHL